MFHHYLTVCSLKREGDGQGGENLDRKRRAEKEKRKKKRFPDRVQSSRQKIKKKEEGKKALQNKQERRSHVEPISL